MVTGDHYIRVISDALDTETKKKIGKPVIFNCSGYEKDDTIELMRNKIDVFLPDFKYSLSETAAKYSFAPDYPETAKRAILKMFGMTGPCSFDKNGMITKGVIIRHLILPGNLGNTFGVIDWVNENFKPGEVVFSLMSQYTPCRENNISAFPELCRKLTDYEKRKAEKYLLNTDITLAYTQEDGSAEEAYIPVFN